MADTLWAPWRMDYILGEKPNYCVFCAAAQAAREQDEEHLVLHRGNSAFVMLNRYPYTHAHVMVLPYRHIARLDELEREEHVELFDLLVKTQILLERALHPQGYNVGINLGVAAGAGIEYHLHAHIVPRWNGDTNFMPMLADARVMPEHLNETYKNLKTFFSSLDSSTAGDR